MIFLFPRIAPQKKHQNETTCNYHYIRDSILARGRKNQGLTFSWYLNNYQSNSCLAPPIWLNLHSNLRFNITCNIWWWRWMLPRTQNQNAVTPKGLLEGLRFLFLGRKKSFQIHTNFEYIISSLCLCVFIHLRFRNLSETYFHTYFHTTARLVTERSVCPRHFFL